MEYGHDTFISPFTWRYGSEKMRSIFSEEHKRKLLRRVWVALARSEMKAGLVSKEQVEELEARKDDIDIDRASEIESEIHHDLMAEIRTYAEQCPKAGGMIHLGATSMDILDNADAIRFKEALALIESKLTELIDLLCEKALEYSQVPTMAFTHIQPAEITTIGYRLAQTVQDLNDDRKDLRHLEQTFRGKGFKGAVGTMASYAELLKGTGITPSELERSAMEELEIVPFTATTQIYTRKQDLRMMENLSNIACSLHKFSQDFRILQSPPIGEFSEPFGKKQVGSSAMPFKRNPINSEKIDSLARIVASFHSAAWENAASTVLERSLDDSANRRIFIPEAFLALDEMLDTEVKIVKAMSIHSAATNRLMDSYGIFSATERLLMEAGRRGADRQEMHEVIREASIASWAMVQEGKANPLKDKLMADDRILRYFDRKEIEELLDASSYIGEAASRTEIVCREAKA